MKRIALHIGDTIDTAGGGTLTISGYNGSVFDVDELTVDFEEDADGGLDYKKTIERHEKRLLSPEEVGEIMTEAAGNRERYKVYYDVN